MTTDSGRVSGSRASTEPVSAVSALSGFDPARVILCSGYFDGPGETPAYDPGPGALCPVCDLPMGELNAQTTLCRSLWATNDRSHFFYYHAACAGSPKIEEFEHAVVDQIVAQESA